MVITIMMIIIMTIMMMVIIIITIVINHDDGLNRRAAVLRLYFEIRVMPYISFVASVLRWPQPGGRHDSVLFIFGDCRGVDDASYAWLLTPVCCVRLMLAGYCVLCETDVGWLL